MEKIKNLHIMPNDKFNKEFIEFINKNFNKEEHYFLLISVPSSKVYNISEDTNLNVFNYEFKTPKKSILRAPLLAIQLIKFYKILYSMNYVLNVLSLSVSLSLELHLHLIYHDLLVYL